MQVAPGIMYAAYVHIQFVYKLILEFYRGVEYAHQNFQFSINSSLVFVTSDVKRENYSGNKNYPHFKLILTLEQFMA